MTNNHSDPATDRSLQDLVEARDSLLALHTLLLGIERTAYEQRFGKLSSGEMLKLVIGDGQFAWLRIISQLIVRIDEMLDLDESVTVRAVAEVIDETMDILKPSESNASFHEKYLAALQNEPDVIFTHRETKTILARAMKNLG